MDPQKLRELFPNISNRSTFNIDDIFNRPLSPQTLNKQTYLEIFKSRKESLKKPINFINYSNMNYNVISNNPVSDVSVYSGFLGKRVDYESQLPQYRDFVPFINLNNQVIEAKLLDPLKFDRIKEDRKQMRINMRSHILKNIKNIKEQSVVSNSLTINSQHNFHNNNKGYFT